MAPGHPTLIEFSMCHIISEVVIYQHFLGAKSKKKKKI